MDARNVFQAIKLTLIASGFALLFLAVGYSFLSVSSWIISSNWNIGSNWVVTSNSVALPIPVGISISIIKKMLEFFREPVFVVTFCVAMGILSLVVKRRNNNPPDFNKI